MFKKNKNFWVAKYIINKVKRQISQKIFYNKLTLLMYKELVQISKKKIHNPVAK